MDSPSETIRESFYAMPRDTLSYRTLLPTRRVISITLSTAGGVREDVALMSVLGATPLSSVVDQRADHRSLGVYQCPVY